jgi:tRNA modification GTPase
MVEADREYLETIRNIAHNDGDTELEDKKRSPSVLVVWNKIDKAALLPSLKQEMSGISAKTGEGIAELEKAIISVLNSEAPGCAGAQGPFDTEYADGAPGIAAERQTVLVDRSLNSLKEALALADRGSPLDLIAPLLRDSVDALGEITGEVSTADILDAMFSRFCVGK